MSAKRKATGEKKKPSKAPVKKNPDKKPNPLKWSPALRKAILEKKNIAKRKQEKQNRVRQHWWNNERRLWLFMHIVKYKGMHITEMEWREIADKFGRTWNGIRLEYSSLMGKYFADHKKRVQKPQPVAQQAAQENSTEKPDKSLPVNPFNAMGTAKKRSTRLNEGGKRPAYCAWNPSKFARIFRPLREASQE